MAASTAKNNNSLPKLTEFLSSTFMFDGLEDEQLLSIAKKSALELCSFEGGEKIFTPEDFQCKIGFVVSGACDVKKVRDGKVGLPLNRLSKGDSFGILTIFSGTEKYPTEISATKKSTVLFIPKSDVVTLIEKYPKIAKNIICFLSERINFLNDKISTFSAENVEQKLAKHLMLEAKKQSSSVLALNHKKTAEIINSGRASLYRAIDALTAKGLIKTENKKIIIADPEGLERISK